MEVRLLYQCDEWLSASSMVLMGIFTDDDALHGAIKDLIMENADMHENCGDLDDIIEWYKEECGEDFEMSEVFEDFIEETTKELLCNGQTQGFSVNYMITCVDTDAFGEI